MSKITIERKVLEQAIDALVQNYSDIIYDGAGAHRAKAFEDDIKALRKALAQQAKQEHVAELTAAQKDRYKFCAHIPQRIAYEQWAKDRGYPVTLEGDGTYSGGLTAQHDWFVWLSARTVLAATTVAPHPQQEPVAYLEKVTGRLCVPEDAHRRKFPMCYLPLYTSPQAQPLTVEQIESIYTQETGALIDDSPWALVDFVRAIEQAHGITKGAA